MSTPFPTSPDRVVVDVWSDIMCPFCFMGDELLSQAIAQADHDVEVRYHSYQLMPGLPHDAAMDVNELLETSKGISREQADAMNKQVAARAATLGLEFNVDTAIATNTARAHRLIHHAATEGKQQQMARRLFEAYFSEGRNVGDPEVLADLATEVGLDRDAGLNVVLSDAYAAEFADDVQLAREIGITGVPFFVLDGKYAISGAQPLQVFNEALATAWQEHSASA